MVRADILAGQKEQGSNSAVLLQRTLTLLQETKGDNQRWAIQLHHLQQDINILHAGMKGNYSLRLAAVNGGWVILAMAKTAERHWIVTATGQCCMAHIQRGCTRVQVTQGQACRLHWQQRQTGAQKKWQLERKWHVDAWSKRNFTVRKTLSSCEATCLQGSHRLQGLLLFWYLGNLVSIQ